MRGSELYDQIIDNDNESFSFPDEDVNGLTSCNSRLDAMLDASSNGIDEITG